MRFEQATSGSRLVKVRLTPPSEAEIREELRNFVEAETGLSLEILGAAQNQIETLDRAKVRRFVGFELGLQETQEGELTRIYQDSGPLATLRELIQRGLIRGTQQSLAKQRTGLLSEEVEKFCEEAQARFIVESNGQRFPRLAADDPLADNSELILGLFQFPDVALPASVPPQHEKIVRLQSALESDPSQRLANLVMRLPSEHFKLLIYYGRMRSLSEIEEFLNCCAPNFEEGLEEVSPGRLGDPVSVVGDLPLQPLECLLARAKVGDARQLGEFLFDHDRLAYIHNTQDRFNRFLCDKIEYPSYEDFAEILVRIGRVILGESYDREARSSGQGRLEKPILANIASITEHLQCENIDDLNALLNNADLISAARTISNQNLAVVLELGNPRDAHELLQILVHPPLQAQALTSSFVPLLNLVKVLELEGREKRTVGLGVLCNGFGRNLSQSCEQIAGQITQLRDSGKITLDLAAYRNLLTSLLSDTDYAEQNLVTFSSLLDTTPLTTAHLDRLQELRSEVNGFITPTLARRYIALEDNQARAVLLESYRRRMREVLGCGPVALDDLELVAEIIYLAYRPVGYNIRQIEMELERTVCDQSKDLSALNLKAEGHPFQFKCIVRKKAHAFDVVELRALEQSVFRKPSTALPELLKGALSRKKAFSAHREMLFASLLTEIDDYRVGDYIREYKEGKLFSEHFSEERLERLTEILRLVPKEAAFRGCLSEAIRASTELFETAVGAVEQELWLERKGRSTERERALQTMLRKLELRFKGDYGGENATVLEADEITLLNDIGLNVSERPAAEVLKDIRSGRWELLFGQVYDSERIIDEYHNLLLATAETHLRRVRLELRKSQAVTTGQAVEGRAYVSKNVGSFYAKAGAELCTAGNVRMWQEARHAHLNFEIKSQIVGNVMLYFEPGRDYLVARGFNPRNDTLASYERRSVAEEMVRVVVEVAREIGYREVFIVEQGPFFALSNREGAAKEVLDIAARNQKALLRADPDTRTEITNAGFNVVDSANPLIYQRLILLART